MKTQKRDLWSMMSPSDEELLAEALAKTDEEVAESLIAKGYDLAKLDAELVGLIDRLPARKDSKRGFIAGAAALASTAATLGSGIYAYVAATVAPVVTATAIVATAHSAAPPDAAEALREDASRACAVAQWEDCIEELDEARTLDPDGDARVEPMRQQAERALGKPEGGAR